MKNLLNISILIISLMIIAPSCNQADLKSDQAKEEISEAVNSVSQVLKAEKQELQEDFRKIDQKLDDKIKSLESDMENVSDEAQKKIQLQIDILEGKKDFIAQKADKLKDNLAENWADFRKESKEALQQIEEDLDADLWSSIE